MLAITTISFDIAGLELFLPLAVGGTVLLVDRAAAADGAALAATVASLAPTVMQATPTTWRMLVDGGWAGAGPALKMLSGGEPLTPKLAQELLATGATLFNVYGPTETTIWSSLCQVTGALSNTEAASVCIGPAIAETDLHVLDEQLRPVPPGTPGELFIGGEGLARGYHRRPALTAERFLANPFGGPGERMYRTGDRVRRRADGCFEFLGRLDHQLKVRGVRIEPAEIEAVLARHPAVRGVVVTARPDRSSGVQLVAYLVAETTPSLWEELAALLRRSVPESHLPSSFVFLPAFPTTPAGKVDREALPDPQPARSARASYVAPTTEVERQIAAIWQEVLGLERVGLDDNFFEMGGHSLVLGRTRAKLESAFGHAPPMRELFQLPTVRTMAAYLAAGDHPSAPGAVCATEARRLGRERMQSRRRHSQEEG
jgi:acyl-coenzyme A synthetase/AMP-(fatty) acid ligase/acyl carrier protein